MIDPALLRDHPDVVRASQQARQEPVDSVDVALGADRDRRAAITVFEDLRAQQKRMGAQLRAAGDANRDRVLRESQQLKDATRAAEQVMKDADAAASDALSRIGNIVLDGVPAGGEADFVTLRTWGEPRRFDFEPLDHLALGERLGAIDMERGTKVSGSRFYFLTGIGARLELALLTMALDRAMAAGFTPMIVPTLVKPEVMRGTGFLGAHADEVYRLEADDLYLVGTSEVPLAGYHMDEIVDLSKGPLRYAGWSTCYRREAGSYGKDTRGIIRVHQFDKLEMFVYTTPDAAADEHERLVALQEDMLQSLGLAYRVIDVAAGDLGSSAARKYDIEAWVPTQDAYRELTSTSNCTTYQARRLDIRFRGDGRRTEFVATLNGTLATTRWIVAILETHQQADGSVVVPEALRGYLGGLAVLEPVA